MNYLINFSKEIFCLENEQPYIVTLFLLPTSNILTVISFKLHLLNLKVGSCNFWSFLAYDNPFISYISLLLCCIMWMLSFAVCCGFCAVAWKDDPSEACEWDRWSERNACSSWIGWCTDWRFAMTSVLVERYGKQCFHNGRQPATAGCRPLRFTAVV